MIIFLMVKRSETEDELVLSTLERKSWTHLVHVHVTFQLFPIAQMHIDRHTVPVQCYQYVIMYHAQTRPLRHQNGI